MTRFVSTAIIILMLNVVAIFPDRPYSLSDLQLIILIIPIIRIVQTIIEREYYRYIYIFFIMYLIFIIDNNSNECDLQSRIFILLLNITLIAYFMYLFTSKTFEHISTNITRIKMFNSSLIFLTIMLVISDRKSVV